MFKMSQETKSDRLNNVIIAEKIYHRNLLHAAAERKQTMPFKDSPFYLEFIPTGKDFTLIRLMACDKDNPIKYTYIPRAKKIITKAKSLISKLPSSQITLPEQVEIEEVI